jgi:hypothetical protein
VNFGSGKVSEGTLGALPVRIAARSIEHDAKMIAQSRDRFRMIRVRVAVGGADNNRPESISMSATRRKHGGHQGIALEAVRQGGWVMVRAPIGVSTTQWSSLPR